MPFSPKPKDVNEISAMLKQWALRMKNIPNSYKIKLLTRDNLRHEEKGVLRKFQLALLLSIESHLIVC